MSPLRRVRRVRTRYGFVPLRPLRRLPTPVRRRPLPLRLRGGRSRRDRRGEICGPPLPGGPGGHPSPRGSRGAMDGPDAGRGSSDRGPGTGPPLEIPPAGVQPPRADRFPPFTIHRPSVRSAGAIEDPGEGSAGASSRDPPPRKRPWILPRAARPQGSVVDPPARRRIHLGSHGGSVRPRLEKRRRGLYSGRDDRARRPLNPMRGTESPCPSRRSSPRRCSSASM